MRHSRNLMNSNIHVERFKYHFFFQKSKMKQLLDHEQWYNTLFRQQKCLIKVGKLSNSNGE